MWWRGARSSKKARREARDEEAVLLGEAITASEAKTCLRERGERFVPEIGFEMRVREIDEDALLSGRRRAAETLARSNAAASLRRSMPAGTIVSALIRPQPVIERALITPSFLPPEGLDEAIP